MQEKQQKSKYDHIIDLPHHVSYRRPHMSRIDRAAQFSPFAALTGYDAAVKETARLTETQVEQDETARDRLSERLRFLADRLDESPTVTVTYFKPDEKKQGGAYVSVSGTVKELDEYTQTVMMSDRAAIPMATIRDITGPIFDGWEEE